MTSLTPTTPENCRQMAVECGRRANKHWAFGETNKARREIERARELTLLALKLEQDSLPVPQSQAATGQTADASRSSSGLSSEGI